MTKSIVMISYVPLFAPTNSLEPGLCYELDLDNLQGIFDGWPDGQADACVWLRRDNEIVPCFLIENAAAIAEHLKIWSEGRPEKWFQLCTAEHGGLYGIALMPRIDRSIERFRAAYHLHHGLSLPKDIDVIALSKPLHFNSQPGHMFEKVKPLLKSRCRLFLMEESEVDRADLSRTDWENSPIDLGPFEINFEAPEKSYILQQLADQLKIGRA